MPFLDSLDIANRALFHLGQSPIAAVDEDSKANQVTSFLYDTERQAELRRNVWRFATRRSVLRAVSATTLMLAPKAWKTTSTYLPGAIVADDNGDWWTNTLAANVGNEPGTTTAWDEYFGPRTADLYDSTITYEAGELVYKASGNPGGFVVFRSLQSANSDAPTTATAWVTTAQYTLGDTVSDGGFQWRSLIAFNTGITPAEGPLDWNISVTYGASQTATGSDGFIYSSVGSGNLGNDPTLNPSLWTNTGVARAWTKVPTLFPAATKWLPLYAGLTQMPILYPIGSGPSEQSATRNIFVLPAGFLREAPLDPKAGAVSFLGAPGGLMMNDYTWEEDYITSSSAIIMMRYVADVRLVSRFDPMFCEGLAARIAIGGCEPITQSTSKLQNAGAMYEKFMGDARRVNGIETGAVSPPEDDFLACRY